VGLLAVTLSTAGVTLNDWVTEAGLYVLFPACDAVILHTPTPLVVPLVVHGPDAVKLTDKPEEDDALNENVLPYCTLGNGAKVIVCDVVLEPAGRIMNVPEAGLAAL
jgi:hypothetical protein